MPLAATPRRIAMSQPLPPAKYSPNWPERLAIALSIFAVLLSVYTLVDGRRLHNDERAAELLDAIYGDWDDLSMIDHWEVLHLNESGPGYEQTRDRLREYVASLPHEEQLRVALLERAMAGRILGFWEHHLNQWRVAAEANDTHRLELLQVELDYWCQDYLRNPRLLWFVDPGGGGLIDWIDPPNREIYEDCVLHDPEHPLEQQPDPLGVALLP